MAGEPSSPATAPRTEPPSAPTRAPAEMRVLMLAPTARDAEASRRLLESAGLSCHVCPDLDRLCHELENGAAAVVVPEEAVLADDTEQLGSCVYRQPVWSDLPIIVLTRAGVTESPALASAAVTLGNVSLIERPLRVSTLLSVLRTALRARERQYQVRDQLDRQLRDEAALRTARDAAEAASRAKDRFLAALSHELRTPLSPVTITLDSMAHDADLPPQLREDVEMIRRNIDLETKLIDDLLDLSRVANGKLSLRLQTTGVHELLRHVLKICSAELAIGHQRVQFDLAARFDRVMGDPARLQQVFWNLVKNAIKFTAPAQAVIVRSSNPDAGTIRVEVRDEGVGIAPNLLPRVFDAFEQGEAPRHASPSAGLGLGLAISKAVVDMHGGKIAAASEGKGRGATFMVELTTVGAESMSGPLSPASPRTQAGGSATVGKSETVNANGAATRVLLVEDHPDTAKVMAKLLRKSGYLVREAHNVADALMLADAEPFDIVVSDIGLPDASGYDLMRQLRDRTRVRGIALSGYGMEDDMRRSREAGFEDHIVKPVSVPQLRAAIERLATPGRS